MRFSLSPSTLVSLFALASVASASALNFDKDGESLDKRNTKTKVTTCTAVGQYPTPQNGACKPCSWKFGAGAAACTTTKVTRCSTGLIATGATSCVAQCPVTAFASSGVCKTCSSKFPSALTCTSSKATSCSTGYLNPTTFKCAATCPSGYVNVAKTKTCTACSVYDTNAASCSAGKIASCNSGTYLNSAKTACVACSTVNPNALTCTSATSISLCASPYTVSTNKQTCNIGSTWSYYLSSSIPDVDYSLSTTNAALCGRNAVSVQKPVAEFDSSSNLCYSAPSLTPAVIQTLTWDTDSSVFIYGTCKSNNAIIPDAKARCYDATLTATSCTLSTRASCTTLMGTCDGDQFRNYNGLCQDCASAYDDSLTCDIFNGATSCIDGDYVLPGTGEDAASNTCASCTDFDLNAATCTYTAADQSHLITGCNAGWVVDATNNVCIVDTSAVPTTVSNAWSYYMDSSVATGATTPLTGTFNDAFDCAEAAYDQGFTLSSYDDTATAGTFVCNAITPADVPSTNALLAAIVENDDGGAAVMAIGTCSDNEDGASDIANSSCFDITLDSMSCTLADGSDCA